VDSFAGGRVRRRREQLSGKLIEGLQTFLRFQLELEERPDEKSLLTWRDHHERAALIDPRAEEFLEGPPLDDSIVHVYGWWLACNEFRTEEQRLKPETIEAYFRWHSVKPCRQERRLFDAIEDEFLTYRREQFRIREEKRLRDKG
jgi:hypothetical protein